MIWQSIFLMTVVDILILGIVGYSAAVFLMSQRRQAARSSQRGFFAIFGGLSLVALFYLADLLAMHAVPSFMPRAEAMAIMRELHLNGSWLVALLGIGTLCFGFASVTRATAALVGDLDARERALDRELAERKQTEQALRESRDQIRLIADNLPFAISYLDGERRYRFVNRTVEKWFSRPAEEILGHTIGEVLGQEAHEAVTPHVAAALNGKEQQYERVIAYPDGKTRTVELTYVPDLDESETVRGCFAFGQDITERKRAEAKVRELNAQFKVFLDNVPEAISLKDIDGRYLLVNAEFERMVGLSSEEIHGKTDSEMMPWVADLSMEIAAHERAVLESGTAVTQERDSVLRDGSAHSWIVTKFPVLDGNGEVVAIGTTNTDITERRRAEDALKDSEERFHTVLDSLPSPIFLKDIEGRYLFANKAFEERLGLKFEDIAGKTYQEVMFSKSEISRPHLAHEREVRETREAIERELPIRRPDGTTGTGLVVRFPVFGAAGDLIAVGCSINTDITERKRAEEALRESEARLSKAAEMAKIGYWVWDKIEDKAIYCSEELAKMYGVASGVDLAAVCTSHVADRKWVHPDDQERFDQAVRTANETKRGFDIEYRIINAAGEVRHLHNIEEPVFDARGEMVRSNGLTQDITEQKRAEEQLSQSQKMEAVGQLTGGVAHDFNNLLGVILGNLELADEDLGNQSPVKPYLASAMRATSRGAELTQRLLAFSRKQALRPQPVEANRLVRDMTDLLRRTLGETIEIETIRDAGLWTCVADPGQLENVVLNLAINARDAMPGGGKLTIEVANARLDDEYAAAQEDVRPGQYVLLAVTDTGTGMSPEVRQHAFEPFYTTKDAGEGSGLGLSMVYGFAKQSEGHVTIYSEVGVGTTVKLYLPRHYGAGEITREKTLAEEMPRAHGETVLVVEDDADLRTLVVVMLESLGYDVIETSTGKGALEILGRSSRVSLLLTDVVLPGGMSGRQIAEEADRRDPGLPILFMSGYSENAIIHQGRLDANVQLLQKPFRKADIAREVRKALDSARP